MAQQYWLGGFYIDLSRNQITHNQQTQTLPPKALAVLTYLAEHQGQVVSQEALLDHVWKGTVVAPNTLQRSIAQLRKALGDDGKAQGLIKTHAKKGYSLESDVRWHLSENQSPRDAKTDTTNSPNAMQKVAVSNPVKAPQKRVSWVLFSVLFLLASAVAVHFYATTSTPQLIIKDIRPLTSTDNKELASIYSPDGEYVVFKRYSEVLCVNNLWAKNLKTQQEFQLTKELDAFGSLSFSQDGKTLAFIKEEDCREPITQKSCYFLQSLDFEQALISPQDPTTLMECKNSVINSAEWLNNDEIALLQKHDERWRLIRYSISKNQSETLYELQDGNLINYDFSPEQNLIALISTHHTGENYIEILTADGQLHSSHPIQYPQEIANFRNIYANFSPLDDQLVFSTGRQLFALSYQGEVTKISVPLDEPMGSPVFHPNGKKMLAIKGHYDSDIISVPLAQFSEQPPESNKPALDYTTLERSTFGEDLAKYQPGGDLIAYWSVRSGIAQVWLTDGNNPQQLSQFPMDTFAGDFIWASDGNSILVNATLELIKVDLDGKATTFELPHPVAGLLHWDTNNQSVLAKIRMQGVTKFVLINLANGETRIINNKQIQFAAKSDNGQLIYMDQMDRIWQPGPAEDQLISALEDQGSEMGFIVNGNLIYGINEDFQLWSYNLDNQSFKQIAQLPTTIDYITDFNGQHFLMTLRVAARKDVVELSLQ